MVKCEGGNLFIHNNNGYVIVSVAWYKYRPLKEEFIVHYDSGFLIILYACLMSHAFYMTKPFTFLPSFFNNLPTWQHLVWQHICNFTYYIWPPKCAVDCSLSLRCSNNSVHTSVTLCHITQQFTSLPHIILLTSAERYKLWSYSSCSFFHFPITFRRKSLNTLNTTILYLVYSLSSKSHTKFHTPTSIKNSRKTCTLLYLRSHVFRQQSKILCRVHYSFPFLYSAIFTSYYPS